MLNTQDTENVIKAAQTANLLVQDLRELVKSENLLLGDIALEVLEQTVRIEQRLNRVEAVTRTEKAPA